jgi:hypothetical protein
VNPSGAVDWFTTHDDRVFVFERVRLKKRWYWHVQAASGEIVGHGEGYVRRIDAIRGAERHHPRIDRAR